MAYFPVEDPPKQGRLIDLGIADYTATLELQRRLVGERQGEPPTVATDALLLLEHPEVVTLGRRRGSRENVLSDDIPVVEVERGGDVTYHGPGQLVGYPVVRLDGGERDLHAYLRALEEGLIRACHALGLVAAGRKEGATGVWIEHATGARKIASMGIAVRRWVAFHGFALNVSTDLARFRAINPCGFEAGVMTSLTRELGRPVTVAEVKPLVARSIGASLGRNFV